MRHYPSRVLPLNLMLLINGYFKNRNRFRTKEVLTKHTLFQEEFARFTHPALIACRHLERQLLDSIVRGPRELLTKRKGKQPRLIISENMQGLGLIADQTTRGRKYGW